MHSGLMAVLAARTLLQAAAGNPEGSGSGNSCRVCRPALSKGGKVESSNALPLAPGRKLEVARHGG